MKALDDATYVSRGISIVRVDWFTRDPGGGGTVHREATEATDTTAPEPEVKRSSI
jgi:hypothetical protein